MKAYLSKRAASAAERIDARWRKHADAPGLFAAERCHIYFEIDDAKQTIQILHIWDGRRERTPKL